MFRRNPALRLIPAILLLAGAAYGVEPLMKCLAVQLKFSAPCRKSAQHRLPITPRLVRHGSIRPTRYGPPVSGRARPGATQRQPPNRVRPFLQVQFSMQKILQQLVQAISSVGQTESLSIGS